MSVATAADLDLAPDDLAFYFASEEGIEASDLGQFLQRAAVVARQAGAELRVTALRPGSLSVIMKAVRRTRIGRAAERELHKTPMAVGIAGASLALSVATAVASAMSPEEAGVTPIAKAGATVVENHRVERIEIVTVRETIIIMDRERAQEVPTLERRSRRAQPRLAGSDVLAIADEGRRGSLTGGVYDVGGELHFRPDGYRYLVPIDLGRSDAAEELYPEAHFRVSAELKTHRGQPNTIVIRSATRI